MPIELGLGEGAIHIPEKRRGKGHRAITTVARRLGRWILPT
jgi:hypothetical protein